MPYLTSLGVSYIFQKNFKGSVLVKGKYFHDRHNSRSPAMPLFIRAHKWNLQFISNIFHIPLLNSGMLHYHCWEAPVIFSKGFWELWLGPSLSLHPLSSLSIEWWYLKLYLSIRNLTLFCPPWKEEIHLSTQDDIRCSLWSPASLPLPAFK